MHSRTLTPARSRLLVALILGLVAAAVWAAGTPKAGSSQRPTELRPDTALLTTNRSTLKVCVDSKVPALGDAALGASTAASLGQVARHPHFRQAGLAAARPQVDVGCPTRARIAEPGFEYRAGRSDRGDIFVAQPSPYRVYVYVVAEEQLAPLAGAAFRRVPQEVFCSERGSCTEVSTAVYLSAEEIGRPGRLARELTRAAGLDTNLLPLSR